MVQIVLMLQFIQMQDNLDLSLLRQTCQGRPIIKNKKKNSIKQYVQMCVFFLSQHLNYQDCELNRLFLITAAAINEKNSNFSEQFKLYYACINLPIFLIFLCMSVQIHGVYDQLWLTALGCCAARGNAHSNQCFCLGQKVHFYCRYKLCIFLLFILVSILNGVQLQFAL